LAADDALRLAKAESAMQKILQRVNVEVDAVQEAANELEAAQRRIDDNGFVTKLRKGGLPKQAALIGLLLFSFRSIVSTISAIGANDGGTLSTDVVIQSALAILCAWFYFFV
jgi:hypothetical protein